ncbi:hypothetical protein [Chishuiella changwenlii]|uniref:hypothetical protein n=1 Tax=Chishuiella changwenlii TaxID=1434701 RepID=UPI002FDAC1A5
MLRVETGNYRVCKDKTGISNTKVSIADFTSYQEAYNYYNNLEKVPGYNYYIEAEVYYTNTQSDGNGNYFNSPISWVRHEYFT